MVLFSHINIFNSLCSFRTLQMAANALKLEKHMRNPSSCLSLPCVQKLRETRVTLYPAGVFWKHRKFSKIDFALYH